MTMAKSGKSVLLMAGAGFGLMKSLRILANIGAGIGQNAAKMERFEARVDILDVAVSRLAHQQQELQATVDQRVTREELNERWDRCLRELDRGVEERFNGQAKSIEALRLMVSQTDELLQKVLDRLETQASVTEIGTGVWRQRDSRH
jgi:23S rRNA G2069 N7-methylase RlmK/C1962 C5-methylase RlmI